MFAVDQIDLRMGKLNASPWAVKKINSRCATKQMAVYQKRLNAEAKVLKGINHPNIVGKTQTDLWYSHCDVLINLPVKQTHKFVRIPEFYTSIQWQC